MHTTKIKEQHKNIGQVFRLTWDKKKKKLKIKF